MEGLLAPHAGAGHEEIVWGRVGSCLTINADSSANAVCAEFCMKSPTH